MKKSQLLTIIALVISLASFGQVKHETAGHSAVPRDPKHLSSIDSAERAKRNAANIAKEGAVPASPLAPKGKQYMIILSDQELQYLYGIISGSGELTGADLKKYISALEARVHALPSK